MGALRDFVYTLDSSKVIDVLREFDIEVPKDRGNLALLRFEVITPDSFMWRLSVNGSVYYLYVEDYVPDLNYIKNVYNLYLESTDWELIEPRQPKTGEPTDYVISGFDKVFLAKSKEEISNSLFSDHAPRGYSHI